MKLCSRECNESELRRKKKTKKKVWTCQVLVRLPKQIQRCRCSQLSLANSINAALHIHRNVCKSRLSQLYLQQCRKLFARALDYRVRALNAGRSRNLYSTISLVNCTCFTMVHFALGLKPWWKKSATQHILQEFRNFLSQFQWHKCVLLNCSNSSKNESLNNWFREPF